MISEKKLTYYEHVAEHTCSLECQKIITQLIDEVHKLEREANWLASYFLNESYDRNGKQPCPPNTLCSWKGYGPSPNISDCAKCWREAAHKAVKKNDS